MKKTKGFTLVELIVVIAIVGVLAAILVPTMLSYIRKAKLKSANTNAKTAYNAVSEFFTDKIANDGMGMNDILNLYSGQVIDCNVPPQTQLNPAQQAVHDVLSINGVNSGHVWVNHTTINGMDIVYVQWTGEEDADNIPDAVVGQFPDPITWDTYSATANIWKNYTEPV